MTVSIIGAGYVGLVSGACLAALGHDVVCIDSSPERVAELNCGRVPIFEPGLDELVRANVAAGRLSFSTEVAHVASGPRMVMLAVGTPSRCDGRAALDQLLAAVRDISPTLCEGTVIVTKSTVPIGTGDQIAALLQQLRPDIAVSVASNPEFLREGFAIEDFSNPDRIIIGVEDEVAKEALMRLYEGMTRGGAPLLVMNRRTAELTKYVANSFLAVKVGFINEIADLCEKVGANVDEVAFGIGYDHRIGPTFLNAGPGFGGSCFPKDCRALINTANDHGGTLPIIEQVIHANDARKHNIARKVQAQLGGSVRGATIAILGLAFKANTDDMRESPAVDIINALEYWGANIRAYDPAAIVHARRLLAPTVTYADTVYDCACGADAAVIVTDWPEFKAIDLKRMQSVMRRPNLVDLRNVFQPQKVRELGFVYDSVGRL
ncbi:MAG: UDP-glucose/GDP-mannose dehydrogenase family protein [Rhizobiales bacterium]|nr:UDP-glucose/GDP-mannose dehydrogenase family protein [Hyphomicrobiales bacterium]